MEEPPKVPKGAGLLLPKIHFLARHPMFVSAFQLNHPIPTALCTESVDNFTGRGGYSKNKRTVGGRLSVFSEY